jgi:glycosyltransferase involved in cell wall biosynthesis
LIYICIPTHNEQQTVGVVLWKLRQVLTDFPREYQLLVADDASTDKTPQVLEPYTRVLPLTVIRSERRNGQAASLEMLLREAVRRSEYPKRDVIVTLQADFSEEPDDLVPLVKRLEAGADVAVGNKVSDTRRRARGGSPARWPASSCGARSGRKAWPRRSTAIAPIACML